MLVGLVRNKILKISLVLIFVILFAFSLREVSAVEPPSDLQFKGADLRGNDEPARAWLWNPISEAEIRNTVGRFTHNNKLLMAYCVDYGYYLTSAGLEFQFKYNKKMSDEATRVLIDGYKVDKPLTEWSNWEGGFGMNTVEKTQSYITQLAFWKVVRDKGEGKAPRRILNLSYPNGISENGEIPANAEHIVESAAAAAANAHANPYTGASVSEELEVDSTRAKQELLNDGNHMLIGPYKIVTNASKGIDVSIKTPNNLISPEIVTANQSPKTKFNNNEEVFLKIKVGDADASASILFTSNSGLGYVAASYALAEHDPYAKKDDWQDFAALFEGTSPVTKDVSFNIKFPKRKIYVKHVDKDGKPIAGIESKFQIEQLENGHRMRINNLGSYGAYQESYRFGMNSVAYISKSPNYKYKYLGGKKASGVSYESANSNLGKTSDTWDSSKTSVTTNPAINGVEDVTVVEFIYENSPTVEPEPDTKIAVDGGKPNSEGCDTTYTPSGENIKPYIKTSKYFLNEIEYELTDINTQEQYSQASAKAEILPPNFKYKLKKLSVFKLKEGYIENGATQEEIIFGSSKTTLFNMNSGQGLEFKGTNVIYERLNNLSELPTTQEVENALGSKNNLSSSSDFSRSITVDQDKFNGIRKINGSATYQLYDVLNNSYGAERTYKTSNRQYVNVYTPAVISEVKIKTDNFVDHSVSGTASNVIQKNADFTLKITPGIENKIYLSAPKDTKKYISGYVVVFDFAVTIRRKNISSRS